MDTTKKLNNTYMNWLMIKINIMIIRRYAKEMGRDGVQRGFDQVLFAHESIITINRSKIN